MPSPEVLEEEIQARKELEASYGKENVYNTEELQEQFEVESFLAPFCTVKRKFDDEPGTLQFSDRPRLYFNFISSK